MSFRFQDDQTFTSLSGKYKLEVLSPLNGKIDDPSSDGSKKYDWFYRFLDTEVTSTVLWESWFSRLTMEPGAVWVSESGVLVLDAAGPLFSDLVVLTKTGEQSLRIRLSPDYESVEGAAFQSKHILSSTAGTHWRYGALEGIFTIREGEFFIVDLLWGESIVLDLQGPHWLTAAEVEGHGATLSACRREVCRKRLRAQDELEVLSALAAISRNPSCFWLPELEFLETSEGLQDSPQLITGDKLSYRLVPSQYGCLLKLAVRRCGKRPTGRPCFEFQADVDVDIPGDQVNRDELWADGASMTTWSETLSQFGPPDSISHYAEKRDRFFAWAEIWDYYLGVGDKISLARFFWEPGSEGNQLRGFEVVPLCAEQLGDHLVNLWRNSV